MTILPLCLNLNYYKLDGDRHHYPAENKKFYWTTSIRSFKNDSVRFCSDYKGKLMFPTTELEVDILKGFLEEIGN